MNRANSLLLSLLLAAFISAEASAATYRWTDAWGTTHFSDDARDAPEGVEVYKVGGGKLSAVNNPHQNLSNLSSEVPYRREGGSLMIDAEVNGVPLRMVLDTGATMVVIPPAIAEKANISTLRARRVEMQTANGRVMAPQVILDRLTAGNASEERINATVQLISDKAPDVGLLGMSFLERFKFRIDQERKLLLLQQR